MGTNYYACSICRKTFPDYGDEWVSCDEGCDSMFCPECVEKYEIEWDEENDDTPAKNCPVCGKKVILDKEILNHCLKELGKTKEEITQEIKQPKGL